MDCREINCGRCKKLFRQKRKWQLFCTVKCRNEFHKAQQEMQTVSNKVETQAK